MLDNKAIQCKSLQMLKINDADNLILETRDGRVTATNCLPQLCHTKINNLGERRRLHRHLHEIMTRFAARAAVRSEGADSEPAVQMGEL